MEHLEEFDILSGFKFFEAYETEAVCKETNEKDFAMVLRFVNDKHVEIDLTLLDGELHISEPYAVDNDYKQIS